MFPLFVAFGHCMYIIMTHRNNKEVVVTYYVEIPIVVYLKLTDVCLRRVWQVLD